VVGFLPHHRVSVLDEAGRVVAIALDQVEVDGGYWYEPPPECIASDSEIQSAGSIRQSSNSPEVSQWKLQRPYRPPELAKVGAEMVEEPYRRPVRTAL